MANQQFHVSAVCNALVDILVEGTQNDLDQFSLKKGIMHLVDHKQQDTLLQFFQDRPHTVELGGSAMNAIRALAALECKTVFAGMVGQDDFGRKIEDRMDTLGIEAKLGETNADATGSCVIIVTPDGERTMNTCLGASRLYGPPIVPATEIAGSKIFHFCGYQWDTEDQKNAIQKAIEVAKENNTRVSFDLADPFVVENHRDQFKELIEHKADIVFANEKEAELLLGKSAREAGEWIASTGATAVIKLGAKGAEIHKNGEVCTIDPVKTEVIDTTAAGDMFAGGFLFGELHDLGPKESGYCAAYLASDVISRMGATLSESAVQHIRSKYN